MIRIKFQDLYCHFIVILNQMVMLFLLKIGELSMINPIHSESEINSISNTTTSSPSTSNRKSGCLGIIVALIIFTSFFINVL